LIHPDTELRTVSKEVGYGVFATRDIPRGTITWALDPLDRTIDMRRVDGLEDVIQRYSWLTSRGKRILCWDFARYVNHSCAASCLGPGCFELEVAVRDIRAGDQLTGDYGALNLEEPFECQCGSEGCRGVVRPEDFETLAPTWDGQLRAAFPSVLGVEQPLWRWLGKHQKAIEQLSRKPDTVPSIMQHRWPPPRGTVAPRVRARSA